MKLKSAISTTIWMRGISVTCIWESPLGQNLFAVMRFHYTKVLIHIYVNITFVVVVVVVFLIIYLLNII